MQALAVISLISFAIFSAIFVSWSMMQTSKQLALGVAKVLSENKNTNSY